MKLNELLKNVKTEQIYNEANPEITDVCYNSLNVKEGSVFVAISGFKTDGHKYVASACRNGAKAVICERYIDGVDVPQIIVKNSRIAEAQVSANFFGNPSANMKLIGITGTNGKTTVTYLVKQVLDKCGYKTGLIGTNQNMIGDIVLETGRTTPDSFELQKLFKRMADSGVQYVIMEVSSHALELNRVYGCRYAVGAFTNLTQDHLDFHITMDNYAKAKSKLFKMSGAVVINVDDEYGKQMLEETSDNVTTYGVREVSKLRAEDVILSRTGINFKIDDMDFKLGIPGEFSVYNALCAIGICLNLGIELKVIRNALLSAHGVKGRAELVDVGNKEFSVMIDYAHTPDGLENILKTARGFAQGRVVILFGCGGDRDNAKRAIMGKIAGSLADFSVITSDNPRSENPMDIIKMIEEGIKQTDSEYIVVEDRRDAIKYVLNNAQKDDVIILAGKGHETYQIIGNETIHFDEREVVKEILTGDVQ